MVKHDVKKDLRHLYQPTARDFAEVDVPRATYLAIDRHGDPNTTPAYAAAVAALYAVGYATKFGFRGRTGDDFVVGPLEGLWWSEEPGAFAERRKHAWSWTMLIPLADPVSGADVQRAAESAAARKPELPVAEVAVRDLHEGRCLQILHVGSYDDEGPTLARLHHEVMPARGLTWNGPHHEIYLGDPRRVAPDRLRTVLRQPVRPVDAA